MINQVEKEKFIITISETNIKLEKYDKEENVNGFTSLTPSHRLVLTEFGEL